MHICDLKNLKMFLWTDKRVCLSAKAWSLLVIVCWEMTGNQYLKDIYYNSTKTIGLFALHFQEMTDDLAFSFINYHPIKIKKK